jgi:hypothetical protein
MLWNRDGLWNFFKISTSQHHPYSLPFLQNYYKTSIILSFFLPSTKTNPSFPPQKGYGNKYFQDLNWKLCPGKERAPNDPSPPFKNKEKGGEGRSKTWWPMEGSIA